MIKIPVKIAVLLLLILLLESGGGVLDKVVFMVVKYNNPTLNHLVNFTKGANSYLKSKVFEFNFLDYSL